MNINKTALALLMLLVSPSAMAQIMAPVPKMNYITLGKADWAWASPCPPSGGYNGITCGVGPQLNLSYQGTLGWRMPTFAELANGPSVADFGIAGSFACASAWFVAAYSHCDYGDAASGAVFGTAGGNEWYAETWVTRVSAAGAVPEPAVWGMMILGFGMVGSVLRRRARISNVKFTNKMRAIAAS